MADTAMHSGIYGLIDFNGGVLPSAELVALGLDPTGGSVALRGKDHTDPAAVSTLATDGRVTVLTGHLEERDALAAALGLSRDSAPVVVARAAFERWEDGAIGRMTGEWLLADWAGDRLTLAQSPGRRNSLLYTRRGGRLAVGADLRVLTNLGWHGGALDETGLLYRFGRSALRTQMGSRTAAAGVSRLQGGDYVVLTRDSERRARYSPFEAVPAWRGSFDDAVGEAEALLRHIVRGQRSRGADATLLSGGLDSSVIAWLAHEEAGERGPLLALCSAAADGSGLRDELPEAGLVATTLGIALEAVTPPPLPSIYRPLDHSLVVAEGPGLSARHYLYQAFADRAAAHRRGLVFDGVYGEMTVTGMFPLGTMLRRLKSAARRRLIRPRRDEGYPFHVRMAPHRLAALPPEIADGWAARPVWPDFRTRHERWGYFPGIGHILNALTEHASGTVRFVLPFRDLRLLRLFAGFSARFLEHEGLDRAPARAMLKGHLPDEIRLRRSGLPISPDYYQRLRDDAPDALDRLPAFRAAGVDDWLDLDWLEGKLRLLAARGTDNVDDAFPIQLTAMAAEFLCWWRR